MSNLTNIYRYAWLKWATKELLDSRVIKHRDLPGEYFIDNGQLKNLKTKKVVPDSRFLELTIDGWYSISDKGYVTISEE